MGKHSGRRRYSSAVILCHTDGNPLSIASGARERVKELIYLAIGAGMAGPFTIEISVKGVDLRGHTADIIIIDEVNS